MLDDSCDVSSSCNTASNSKCACSNNAFDPAVRCDDKDKCTNDLCDTGSGCFYNETVFPYNDTDCIIPLCQAPDVGRY